MAIRPYPEYKSKFENYGRWERTGDAITYLLTGNPKLISVDTETYYNPESKGISRFIKGNPNNEPFCVTLYDGKEAYYLKNDLQKLTELFAHKDISFVFHNHKYDRHMLANIGVDLDINTIHDTMVMIHLIDEEFMCNTPSGTPVKSKKLKDLAYHFLGEDAHELEDLVAEYRAIKSTRDRAEGKQRGKDDVSYLEVEELNPDLMKDYACRDVEFTWKLCNKFIDLMNKQTNKDGSSLWDAYNIDMKASDAVFKMERRGVKVDLDYYNKLYNDYEIEIQNIVKCFPEDININSNTDLKKLFEDEDVTWRWYTETKEPKVDVTVLETLKTYVSRPKVVEYATMLLEYRELVKIRDTFVKNMLDFCQWDGRVHPDFNVCPNDFDSGSTRTGRLSSSNPNYQNLPKDDKRIRKGIVPKEGFILAEIDAAQQEYRMLAHYSRDEKLINLIKQGVDVHIGTAMLMLGLDHDTAAQRHNRQIGKKLNFAIVYGLGLASLANQLGYKIDEALYRKASFQFMKDKLPWDKQNDIEYLRNRYASNDAVQYYCSAEARDAIEKASALRAKYFNQFPRY